MYDRRRKWKKRVERDAVGAWEKKPKTLLSSLPSTCLLHSHSCIYPLTFDIVVHNVVSVQVGQCLESAPEDVFGVVHHQLQHGGLLLVLHQEVGEGTVAHLGQIALQVSTHARHEVVAEVAGGTLGVLLTHQHSLEREDVVMV